MDALLQQLAASEGFPRISIYLPMAVRGPETDQNALRLKNAVKEAREILRRSGLPSHEVDALLGEAQSRINDFGFWRYQDPGLGIFIEDGATRWMKLPVAPQQLVMVGRNYHVRPLLDDAHESGRYFVLAVTRGSARLLDCTSDSVREEPVEGMPASLDEIREMTNYEDNLGFHSRDRGKAPGGAATAKFHALGQSPEDYDEVLLAHYLERVAKALDRHLASRTERAPLILAADARTGGMLRPKIEYRGLTDDSVQHNPHDLTPGELRDAAYGIARAASAVREEANERQAALEAFLAGDDRPGSRNLETLMRAAEEGRIWALFTDPAACVYGRYDPRHRVIAQDYHDRGGENEDLVNLLALKTLLRGGQVANLPESRRDTGPVVGLYRY